MTNVHHIGIVGSDTPSEVRRRAASWLSHLLIALAAGWCLLAVGFRCGQHYQLSLDAEALASAEHAALVAATTRIAEATEAMAEGRR